MAFTFKFGAPVQTGIALGQTNMTPNGGPSPSLNGWSWTTIPGPWWAEFFRDITGDAVSPYNAAFQTLLATAPNNCLLTTWYGIKADNSIDPRYGMPINQIAGSTPLAPVALVSPYPTPIDPTSVPFQASGSIEGWPSRYEVTCTNNSPTVPIVTNVNGTPAGLLTGGGVIFIGYNTTIYTVGSVGGGGWSLTLTTPFTGTTGNYTMYGPYGLAPGSAAQTGDGHYLCIQRDDATGLPSKLWEAFTAKSDNNGASWKMASVGLWDLVTGAKRPEGFSGVTAAAIPIAPFTVRYEEALAGTINRALRLIVGTGMECRGCVWPAPCANNTFPDTSYTLGHLPLGARVRLRAAWYTANRSSFSTINQHILDALYRYGAINADWSSPGYGLQIEGENDSRWDANDVAMLRTIPVTAFELIDTVNPQYTFTGPASLSIGVPATYTVTYLFDSVNLYYSEGWYVDCNGSTTNLSTGHIQISHGSPAASFTLTPPSSGTYVVSISGTAQDVPWLAPAMSITLTIGGGFDLMGMV